MGFTQTHRRVDAEELIGYILTYLGTNHQGWLQCILQAIISWLLQRKTLRLDQQQVEAFQGYRDICTPAILYKPDNPLFVAGINVQTFAV